MTDVVDDLILWAGTLPSATCEQRLEAAVAAGCDSVSVFPWDCRPPDGARSRARELRTRADDVGVRLAALDPLTAWLPKWEPPSSSGVVNARVQQHINFGHLFGGYGVDEFFAMGCELGCDLVSVLEPYGKTVPLGLGSDAFGAVCDRAGSFGLRVQLEFMPFSGIPELASAWSIVQAADRGNGGILLDTWHYNRSAPDDELLARIPGERIFSVQVSDGPARVESDLWWAAAHERLLPGDGVFDLASVVAIVRRNRSPASFGPEVISDRLSALAPIEAAKRAAAATRAVLREAAV